MKQSILMLGTDNFIVVVYVGECSRAIRHDSASCAPGSNYEEEEEEEEGREQSEKEEGGMGKGKREQER
ncbi:hypothetical protein Q7C36_004503 [Tachysurus vachellii]|uniref:Uncharacterized protein n=1 Tax=Tachysurus vachellii TaxID=175792 RepID=A0AA88NPD6_TACVA|nr:hypothetical protein Q7C36_004503 [Tachysurus vachellii]